MSSISPISSVISLSLSFRLVGWLKHCNLCPLSHPAAEAQPWITDLSDDAAAQLQTMTAPLLGMAASSCTCMRRLPWSVHWQNPLGHPKWARAATLHLLHALRTAEAELQHVTVCTSTSFGERKGMPSCTMLSFMLVTATSSLQLVTSS